MEDKPEEAKPEVRETVPEVPEVPVDCMDPVYRKWLEEHPECKRLEEHPDRKLFGDTFVSTTAGKCKQDAIGFRGRFPGDPESDAFKRDVQIYFMDKVLITFGPQHAHDAKYLFAREKGLIRTGPEMAGLDTYVPDDVEVAMATRKKAPGKDRLIAGLKRLEAMCREWEAILTDLFEEGLVAPCRTRHIVAAVQTKITLREWLREAEGLPVSCGEARHRSDGMFQK